MLFFLYKCCILQHFADMMELADMQDLGSCAVRRAGSTPVIRTTKVPYDIFIRHFSFFTH